MGGRASRLGACALAASAALLGGVPAAQADLTTLKGSCVTRDAADNDTGNGNQLPYRFCDDGVPTAGGRTPNPGAVAAVAVPQKYDGHAGLPPKVAPDPNAGADPAGDIALDVDVSLPDPAVFPPPPGGYPLIAMMHGCCAGDKTGWEAPTVDTGGERWHYSNAWFASRGYTVLNYTARGFVNGSNQGSTGETQLDSRRYEINDFQHLAGQLADDPFFSVDPQRIVATGGSYGGGFSWMALTDPTWSSPGGKAMKLAAVAPKYGWTDLPYSLIPNGAHRHDVLPSTDPSTAADPFGFPKASINAALFASGRIGVPSGPSFPPHTTFSPAIDQAFACLESTDPYESNPLCAGTIQNLVPEFYADRSAYYQNDFFGRIVSDPPARVPIFSAATFTDPLFWPIEHQRMVERLKANVPGYPVQEYYGDYQHFVQNKAKEWGDVCGDDRHVCRLADYPGGNLNLEPVGRRLVGITTQLNAFVDHYAAPQGNPTAPQPARNVTASLQICPQNASPQFPADEPGERFTAPSFAQLAPNALTIDARGTQATINKAAPNAHAAESDPISNLATNGGRCPVEDAPGGVATAGSGVATYDSDVLGSDFTMLGATRVTVQHSGGGGGIQLNARLYDLLPSGQQVMVSRGMRRIVEPNGTTTFDLLANGWRFPQGHRIRIELAQDDAPYIKSSNQPSSLLLAAVRLVVPVRESSASIGGAATGPPPPGVQVRAPRRASDESRNTRFLLRLTGVGNVDHYEVEVRNLRRGEYRRLTSNLRGRRFRFAGFFGSSYRFRVRAVDPSGVPGAWAHATTIVPLDDMRRPRRPRYGRGWRRPRNGGAYGGRISTTRRRGARMRVSFRGRRFYLIGRRTRRGGRARVTVDGRSRVVSFRGPRTRNRVVIAAFSLRGGGAHRVTVVSLGRGRVDLDALGILTG
jgi:hypothetical protein